jgi:hypothetical protein
MTTIIKVQLDQSLYLSIEYGRVIVTRNISIDISIIFRNEEKERKRINYLILHNLSNFVT